MKLMASRNSADNRDHPATRQNGSQFTAKIKQFMGQEIKLSQSTTILRKLIRSSPVGIYIVQDGKFRFLNDRFAGITGYKVDELTNSDSLNLVHPDDREEVRKNAVNLLKSESQEEVRPYEYRIICKSGEVRWLMETVTSITYERRRAALGNCMDITERKQAEELYTTLADKSPVDIYISQNDTFVFVNKSFECNSGYCENEIIGKRCSSVLYPDDVVSTRAKVVEMLRGNRKEPFEFRFVTKNGDIRCALLTVSSITYQGHPAMLGVSIDITERKAMETALQKAREEAETATQAKTEFLAHMSHEIRTPMNAIVGLGHLALKTELNPKQRDYLTKIQTASNTLMGIINDILDLSKIEAGKLEIEKTNFRLDQVMKNISNIIGTKAQEKGLEFQVNISPGVPFTLVGDPLRLGQVIINLAGNAIKFTESGSIVVSAETVSRNNDHVELKFTVKDTGVGMTGEQQARLFQPFTQGDNSITRRYGGTGLGLAISRQLVALMDGEIGVKSQQGSGSEFYFTVGLQTVLENTTKKTAPVSSLKGLKVLVVDDSQLEVEVLKQMMMEMSFEVTVVGTGQEALTALVNTSKGYDLVMLDWRMPDMDGFETARRIKSYRNLPKQPKIFMVTGYGREEVRHQAEELGLDAFLVKPVSHSILFDSIIEVFNHQQTDNEKEIQETGDRITAAGARVLVVEDNEINQQVAREILESYGLVVEIAGNGRIALERLSGQSGDYAAVLMDLQMPEMDGFETTTAIRVRWNKENLPIIAMTAHAMQSEIQRCLETGMNDYVSKPVDPDKLKASLVHWIKPVSGNTATAEDGIPRASFLKQIGPFPEFDMPAALKRLMGNEKLLEKLLRDFLHDHEETTVKINQAIDDGNLTTAKQITHTVKGVAGNLSATEVYIAAQALESNLGGNDKSGIGEAVETLDRSLKSFNGVIKRILSEETRSGIQLTADTLQSNNIEDTAVIIRRLNELIKKNNLNARKVFVELKENIGGHTGQSHVQQLGECLDRLDFKLGKFHIAKLAEELGIELGQERA
jgi:two-component system, sensor histidine kinase and response regulator